MQGRGVGRALLQHAQTGSPAATGRSATIADGLQPISNTLYARHGLLPWLPILGFVGRPPSATRPPLPKGHDAVPLDSRLLDEVRQIDESVTGL